MKNRYSSKQGIYLAAALFTSILSGCDAPADPAENTDRLNTVQPQATASSEQFITDGEPPVSTSSQSLSSASSSVSIASSSSFVAVSTSSSPTVTPPSSPALISSSSKKSSSTVSSKSAAPSSSSLVSSSSKAASTSSSKASSASSLSSQSSSVGATSSNFSSVSSATSSAILSVSIKNATLNDEGLLLDLDCSADEGELELQITGDSPQPLSLDQLTAVSASAGIVTENAREAILTSEANGSISLLGAGIDIWKSDIYFNGLMAPISGDFDLGLTVSAVTGDLHPYAKIGLLVSSTADLNGELLFVHWSGHNGIAEDSGNGGLTQYRQLLQNPNGADVATATPATLRIAYRDGALKVGGCFDCEQPNIENATNINFVPASILVVSSSHNATTITSQIDLKDFLRTSPTNLSRGASCASSEPPIMIGSELFANQNSVNIQVFMGDSVISSLQVWREPSTSSASSEQLSSISSAAVTSSSQALQSSSSKESSVAASEVSSASLSSSSASSSSSTVDVSQADTLYQQQCQACHGELGIGAAFTELYECDVCDDKSQLHNKILTTMPPGKASNCGEDCSAILSNYIYNDFFSSPSSTPVEEPEVSCKDSGALLPPTLRRLSQTEFRASVESVFGTIFPDSAWRDFNDSLPTLGMSNNAGLLNIDSQNFEAVYYSVDSIVDTLLTKHSGIASCLDSDSGACINTLIAEYAPLVWRRPLTSSETQQIKASITAIGENGGSQLEKLEFTFKALMLSPNFLFRFELGETTGEISTLGSYEVASLLSYSLWGTPPDSKLYQLAAQDTLKEAANIEQQVTRMIESPKFTATLTNFYTDFLKLENVLTVEKLDYLGLSSDMRAALLNSVEHSLTDQTANLDQGITDVLAINKFYVNELIAPLFGLNPSDYSNSFTLSSAPTNERNGLLTHPAFLTVHSKEGSSGIVKRGVFNLLQMMCLELGDPPEVLTETPLPDEIDPAITSSRVLLQIRHSAQTECVVCHKFIDPAGFGFENYDALGQFRSVEKEIVPIDATGELQAGSEMISYTNNVEFMDGLMNSTAVKSCMTMRYLEHFSGHALKTNSCEMKKLKNSLESKGKNNIRDIIQSISTLESLRIRGSK